MKNKQLIIWGYLVASFIIVCNCLASEKQLPKESENSQRLSRIEYSYMNKILNLRLNAAARITLLEVAQVSKPNWADINEWANFAEKILQINGCESEPYTLFKTSSETPAERLAVALSRIAKRKSDILSTSELEALKLENQKKRSLAFKTMQLEKSLRESGPIKKSESMQGLITSIVYSPDKSSVVVDSKIMHNGEIIHGVTVVKIYKDRVVFEKNRNRWEQTVRQTPEAYWK